MQYVLRRLVAALVGVVVLAILVWWAKPWGRATFAEGLLATHSVAAVPAGFQGADEFAEAFALLENQTHFGVDRFGCAMAADGEWLAVGARHTRVQQREVAGAVCLYRRNGSGEGRDATWRLWQVVDVVDARPGMEFGRRLAMRNGVLIAAAGPADLEERPEAVYVFEFDPSTNRWRQTARLTCPLDADGHGVGLVVLSHDSIAVGAPDGLRSTGTDVTPPNPAVFVYRRTGVLHRPWAISQRLTPPPDTPPGQFGFALGSNGSDVLVVGAPGHFFGGTEHDGRAFVYRPITQDGETAWSLTASLRGRQGESGAFGVCVSAAGERIAVGQRVHTRRRQPGDVVSVYVRNPAGSEPSWTAENVVLQDELPPDSAAVVEMDAEGRFLAVNAHLDSTTGTNCGSAYVFARSDSGTPHWQLLTKLTPSEPVEHSFFGVPLVFADDELFVGAAFRRNRIGTQGTVFRWRFGRSTQSALPLK